MFTFTFCPPLTLSLVQVLYMFSFAISTTSVYLCAGGSHSPRVCIHEPCAGSNPGKACTYTYICCGCVRALMNHLQRPAAGSYHILGGGLRPPWGIGGQYSALCIWFPPVLRCNAPLYQRYLYSTRASKPYHERMREGGARVFVL